MTKSLRVLFRASFIALSAIVSITALLPGLALAAAPVFTEYVPPTLNGNPTSLVKGPDGRIWFNTNVSNVKSALSALDINTGVITEYALTLNSQPKGLKIGPDGNIWFIKTFPSAKLVQMTLVSGTPQYVEYSIPGFNDSSLAYGPDGNFWYTAFASNAVYSVSTTGVLQRTINVGGGPQGISVGPDGYIWFSEQTTGNISKINPNTGAYTAYPSGGTAPASTTPGPDGNIWFTLQSSAKIGKITPSGSVTLYSVTPTTIPKGITTGPDGNIWAALQGKGLAMINPTTGVVTEYDTPATPGMGLFGIISGPKKSIWYTVSSNASRIGWADIGLDYTPPTTSITSPSNNSVVSGTSTTITASSADDFGVTGLELYVDGVLHSTVSNPTASTNFTLNTTLLSDGDHVLTTKANDLAANGPTTSSAVTIKVDNTSPTTSITSPASNALVSGSNVTVTATSSDANTVSKLELYIDGALNSTVNNPSSPQDFSWDTTSLINGSHTLTTKAYDGAGNTPTTSSSIPITVDNSPPTTSITSPSNNTSVSGQNVQIIATSSDNIGVAKLEFYIDGVLLSTVNNPVSLSLYVWNTSSYTNGNHALTTKVYDTTGNGPVTSSTVTAKVDNSFPTITITAPNNGAVQSGITTISATAADTDDVAGVQFQIDGVNFQGEDTTAPYSISWDTTKYKNGSYFITAIARDNTGHATTSAQVTAAVSNKIKEREDAVITVVVDADGNTTATVLEGDDLSDQNYEVPDKQVLIVDGKLGIVEVKNGATIKGNGEVGDLKINLGAFLSPGKSPGCLTSQDLVLEGTYTFQVGGTTACSEYDQVVVNGTVTLKGNLSIEHYNGYLPKEGEKYTIIDNDSNEPIIGTFTGISEGGSVMINDVPYTITYKGGDGNDVVLTVSSKTSPVSASAPTKDSDVSGKTIVASKKDNVNIPLLVGVGAVLVLIAIAINRQKSKKADKNS